MVSGYQLDRIWNLLISKAPVTSVEIILIRLWRLEDVP